MENVNVLSLKDLVKIQNEIAKIYTDMTDIGDENSPEYKCNLLSLDLLSKKLLPIQELNNITNRFMTWLVAFNQGRVTKEKIEHELNDFLEAIYQYVVNVENSMLERLFRSLAYAEMACTDSVEPTQAARIFKALEEHISEIACWDEIVEIFEE